MNLVEKIDKYLNEREIDWYNTLKDLSDKELFVIGVILGFKSTHRKSEIKRQYSSLKDKYKIDTDEFEKIKSNLTNRGVLTKTGTLKNSKEVKKAWSKIIDTPYPSQLHQWAFK